MQYTLALIAFALAILLGTAIKKIAMYHDKRQKPQDYYGYYRRSIITNNELVAGMIVLAFASLLVAKVGGVMEKFIRGRFPNDDLAVTGPDGKPITGAAALKFILDPIITQEADDASRTKRLPDQQLGQTTPASPAPSRS